MLAGTKELDEETVAVSTQLVEDIADEGIVLLENDGSLPISTDTKLNVFGWGSTQLIYGGTGSGDVAGKDVAEIYFNPPYYNGGIEKPSANLLEFTKTDLLEPGAAQVLTISFNLEDMASYDDTGYGCYVLEHGDYIVSLNADSHTVLDSETVTVDADMASPLRL